MRQIHTALLTTALLASPGLALAAVPAADATFAATAAQTDIGEIAEAKMAEQKGATPAVKTYAQQMITDHSKTSEELTGLAKAKGLVLPTSPSADQRREAADLREKSGRQFDQAYAQDQQQGHQAAVEAFQTEANSGQDPQLKAFAVKYLPVIQHHLQMASDLGK